MKLSSKVLWILKCYNFLHSQSVIECTMIFSQIRVGLPGIHAYGMEDLLYKYGVDLHLTAHEHSYERIWPTYNLVVCIDVPTK